MSKKRIDWEKELSDKYSTGSFTIEEVLILIVLFVSFIGILMIFNQQNEKIKHLENVAKTLKTIEYTNKMVYCYTNPTVFNNKYIFITKYNKINYYIDYKNKKIFSNKGYIVPFDYCNIKKNLTSTELFKVSF